MLIGPVDCKGQVASDGRHYILDVSHFTPRDLDFGDTSYSGADLLIMVLLLADGVSNGLSVV